MAADKLILNRLFTLTFLRRLIYGRNLSTYSEIVRRALEKHQFFSGTNNQAVLQEVYRFLSREYRNEYFYQNTLFNKLLLGVHSVNTTTALMQIPISKAKADFILINGKAVVYEIKTELDSLDRLDTQIENYYKAFNHVCVVTSECHYEKVLERLADTPVGIYVLTPNATLSATKRKEPVECSEHLDHLTLFKVLHKTEYEHIIKKYFGYLPDVCPVFWFRECFKMFSKIPIMDAYKLAIPELKTRNRVDASEFEKVPYELKFLMYFAKWSKKETDLLYYFLSHEFKEDELCTSHMSEANNLNCLRCVN